MFYSYALLTVCVFQQRCIAGSLTSLPFCASLFYDMFQDNDVFYDDDIRSIIV